MAGFLSVLIHFSSYSMTIVSKCWIHTNDLVHYYKYFKIIPIWKVNYRVTSKCPHFWIYVITIWKCHIHVPPECIHIIGAEICLPLEGRLGEWSLKSFSVMLHAFIHLCLITWVVSFGDFRSQQMLLNLCRWPLGQVIPLQTVQRVQNIKSHTEKETLW